MHYLAVCAIFRDEARYLAEWLTHYELQGVEHFYLYDDQSTDHPEKVLAPWVARGMVTLEPVRWASRRQAYAYNHCIRMRRKEAHWIGFFDIDEFAFARARTETLAEIMPRYERFPGLGINWVCYGSSGFEQAPGPLVTTSYQLCGAMDFRTNEPAFLKEGHPTDKVTSYYPYNAHIKSIVQPNEVERMISPHSFLYRNDARAVGPSGQPLEDSTLNAFNERLETSVLRVNHYWSKSLSEFRAKLDRPRADNDEHYGDNIAFIREAGMNLKHDPAILPWSKALADRLDLPFTPGSETEWRRREAFQQARDINEEARIRRRDTYR